MWLIHIYSLWENVEKYGKIGRFSRRIQPDWGNTAWADMAGLGSIGLTILWQDNIVTKPLKCTITD